MEQVEGKMVALKKAYAHVILNMAKESAARIMAAESKAVRFQQNLKDVKDEGLSTLLRLKNIMDAKISEANTISLGQTKRIHELESRLNEADHAIAFLKMELKRANDEMEKMGSSSSKEQDIEMKDQGTCFEDAHDENIPASNLLKHCVVSRSNDVSSADLKKSIISNISKISGDSGFAISDNSMQVNSLQESSPENNPELASLMMTAKEPELYRNGCTQRIRALEQNSTSGKIQDGGEIDGSFTKNVLGFKKEKVPHLHLAVSCMDNDPNSNFESESSLKKLRLLSNRSTWNTDNNTTEIVDEEVPPNNMFLLSDQSMGEHSKWVLGCHNELSPGHQPMLKDEVSIPETKSSETYFCMETISEIERETESPSNGEMDSTLPSANGVVQSVEDETSTENSDYQVKIETPMEIADMKDGITEIKKGRSEKRFLKYTFKRKHMKGNLTNTSENIPPSPENKNTMKRKSCDTICPPPPPPQEHGMVKESPRESRRIAQVARQLISLSDKRW